MSDKEAVIELVKHLPSDVTLREIVQKIEFIAAIRFWHSSRFSPEL